ncbi:MAG TPA: tryptophan halogenase family protein [Steroidobacteraceae bacterium]|nr:tryptophan halogenase family protein [Steroidobacteraceae bacterium]
MEPDRRIRRVAVVGGGSAGWTAAAMLNRKLGGHCSIHVVDAPEVLSPGHAEATLPTVLELVRYLGLDQNEFINKTQSTYSLGTRFHDWSARGETFWHPFGAFGALIERRPFYHFWHKARTQPPKLRIDLFSQEISFGQANRFIFPGNSLGVAPNLRYALNVDGALYTRLVRSVAERGGVIRLERKLVGATRREDGLVDELQFEDGSSLRADLYIDCTGSRAQVIGEILGTGWQDWSKWLPCDREVSVPGSLADVRAPYVQNTARPSGWQWRMALQQVVSHGQVYSSAHQGDDEALKELMPVVGDPLAEPRVRRLGNGRRTEFWRGNVVALGAAAGCVEPVTAADHHLIINALFNLLDHFPDRQFDPAHVASYNAIIGDELERIRDFTLLHYRLTRRDDSPFWRDFAAHDVPDTLAQRIEMYRAAGRIILRQPELFGELDWFWIFEGMGVIPRDYDPLVDTIDYEQVKRVMLAISQKVSADTAAAPTHDSFFAQANARLAGMRRVPNAAAPSPSAG